MLGNIGGVLQQIASQITTGQIVLAIATIAIAIVGYSWATGHMAFRTMAGVILGIAIVGSAGAIASAIVSG